MGRDSALQQFERTIAIAIYFCSSKTLYAITVSSLSNTEQIKMSCMAVEMVERGKVKALTRNSQQLELNCQNSGWENRMDFCESSSTLRYAAAHVHQH